MASSENQSGNWLITYSDLVTLLMVFFVLLYMMTPGVDEAKFNNYISFFQQSTGMLENTSIEGQALRSAEIRQIIEQWEALEEFVNRQDLEGEISVEATRWGMKITMEDQLTFASGSAELLPGAGIVIDQISRLLDSEVLRILVHGHTDNVPVASASRYPSNWHLGAARAVSVLYALQMASERDPGQFEAVSFGEYQPVASNETAESRSRNRRVEIQLRYRNWTYEPDPVFELDPELPDALE